MSGAATTRQRQHRKSAAAAAAKAAASSEPSSSDDEFDAEDAVSNGSQFSRPASRGSRPWSGRVSRPTSAMRRSAAAAGSEVAPSHSLSSLLWGPDRSGLSSTPIRSLDSPYSDAPSRMMG